MGDGGGGTEQGRDPIAVTQLPFKPISLSLWLFWPFAVLQDRAQEGEGHGAAHSAHSAQHAAAPSSTRYNPPCFIPLLYSSTSKKKNLRKEEKTVYIKGETGTTNQEEEEENTDADLQSGLFKKLRHHITDTALSHQLFKSRVLLLLPRIRHHHHHACRLLLNPINMRAKKKQKKKKKKKKSRAVCGDYGGGGVSTGSRS